MWRGAHGDALGGGLGGDAALVGERGDAELGGEQLGLGAVRAAQAREEALEAALLGHHRERDPLRARLRRPARSAAQRRVPILGRARRGRGGGGEARGEGRAAERVAEQLEHQLLHLLHLGHRDEGALVRHRGEQL